MGLPRLAGNNTCLIWGFTCLFWQGEGGNIVTVTQGSVLRMVSSTIISRIPPHGMFSDDSLSLFKEREQASCTCPLHSPSPNPARMKAAVR